MTTCNDIVRLAMARLRLLRGGEIPTAREGEDGLIALQSLYDQFVSDGLFGRLNDTIPSGNYTAQEQDRVINDGAYTITLPLTITPIVPMGTYYPIWPDERIWTALQSSATRPPRHYALIEVIWNGSMNRYVYDARKRFWIALGGLALTDLAPLADRGATGLAACLAENIADEYGAQVSPATAQQATMFRWALSSRYEEARVANMADYF